jgi:hypothetical protein
VPTLQAWANGAEEEDRSSFAGFQLAEGHLDLSSSHVVFWAVPLSACTSSSIEKTYSALPTKGSGNIVQIMTTTADNDKRESSASLFPSTPTMRQKARSVGQCFLNLLKFWRYIKCTKKNKKNPQNV